MSILMYRWEHLPWETIERQVYKLQKRIYQASLRDDTKAVHTLQRLLMHCWSAKCLAVRRVTQDNQGKNTAGIDGIKRLRPNERMALVHQWDLDMKAQPVRRVWIPKPGTREKRGLGIPVMQDRALQALLKLALEPEWEARFEPNSYGFRPGRSGHDAIEEIYSAICKKPRYVLDADMAKCFDRINHQALLTKLATFPTMRRAIKAWLKAGMMEDETLFPSKEGTPQGGVASPLLANIALHGLETAIRSHFPKSKRLKGKTIDNWKPVVIRYADDFVVLHQDVAVIEQVKQIVNEWVAGMGLELKPSKTRITQTLDRYEGNVGFDFLGFHVQQHRVGKTHTGKMGGPNSFPLGFKTHITPSKEALHRHLEAIGHGIKQRKAQEQKNVIGPLNLIIRGWSNYYSRCMASETFGKADHLTWIKLMSWAKRRHNNKSVDWITNKYWHTHKRIGKKQVKWDVATHDGVRLLKHQQFHIVRHIKIREDKNPFDGDWVYWATRMGRHPDLNEREAQLLKRQQGKCPWCELYFKDGDVLELDHIIPRSRGGRDSYTNWQVLHRHCHDRKTAGDGSLTNRGTHNKSQATEELDESKDSRPVLKTSKGGNELA